MGVRRFLIRADGGPKIGSGHLVRCLALAGRLQALGAEIVLATRESGAMASRFRTEGHRVIELTGPLRVDVLDPRPWPTYVQREDAFECLRLLEGEFEGTIVDHYRLDYRWERIFATVSRRVIVIDDLADRDRIADVLVDQNWYGPGTHDRHDGRVPEGCRKLIGPRYALLQPEYASLRRERPEPTWPPQRILVAYGGTDSGGETGRALDAIASHPGNPFSVDVVVGNGKLATSSLRAKVERMKDCRLHVALPSLAPLLARADLAFAASGMGTWERNCLGVPAIVTTTHESQSGVTRALADAGLTSWLGVSGGIDVTAYRRVLLDVVASGQPPIIPLADGHGVGRAAETLLPSPAQHLQLRRAVPQDDALHIGLGSLRGGATARDVASEWSRQHRNFVSDLASKQVLRLTIDARGTPVGMVRAVSDGRTVSASFVLDSKIQRGDWNGKVSEMLLLAEWKVKDGRLEVDSSQGTVDGIRAADDSSGISLTVDVTAE